MKKKEPVVKTKRMMIQPMSDQEIEKLIETSESGELRAAYEEMLSGCKENPDNRMWYAPWKMMLEKDHTYIGNLGFKGSPKENSVEIGYGILPECEGKGYTTEAVQAMTQWAFANAGVTFVEAETEPDNKASQRVLEKCGFTPDGEGKEGPRFVLEAAMTNWMMIYMLFGLSIGTALGSSFDSQGTGMCLGLCFGMCVGSAIDVFGKKEREKIREQRKNRRQSFHL